MGASDNPPPPPLSSSSQPSCHALPPDNTTSTTSTSSDETSSKPWYGELSGATWNANGLVCSDPYVRADRFQTLGHLINHHDFVIVTETHATPLRTTAAEARMSTASVETFWSHHPDCALTGRHRETAEGAEGNLDSDGESSVSSDFTGKILTTGRRKGGIMIMIRKK